MSLLEKMPEATKERWRTAGRFADVLEAEVKARQKPFITRVVTWFNLCRVCQDLEEQLLLANRTSADDLQLHRALLSLATSAGEGLLLECTEPRLLEPLGITSESIEAKLDSLRITFEQWHTESDPTHQATVLKEVFGGEA